MQKGIKKPIDQHRYYYSYCGVLQGKIIPYVMGYAHSFLLI